MSTTQQAIEALDELLRDAFMYIRHNPGAGSDPLLVRLKGTKTMMDALASLPQQDVGAGRPVPSPVGQEPTVEQVLEEIQRWTWDHFKIQNKAMFENMRERLAPLFTHPPKAGVLTDSMPLLEFRSQASGLWYGNPKAAGTVDAVRLFAGTELPFMYELDVDPLNPEQ